MAADKNSTRRDSKPQPLDLKAWASNTFVSEVSLFFTINTQTCCTAGLRGVEQLKCHWVVAGQISPKGYDQYQLGQEGVSNFQQRWLKGWWAQACSWPKEWERTFRRPPSFGWNVSSIKRTGGVARSALMAIFALIFSDRKTLVVFVFHVRKETLR